MDGSSRALGPRAARHAHGAAALRVEARPERRLGNLELGLAGLARGEPARSSVPGRASARAKRRSGLRAHPAEDLDRSTERPERSDEARGAPVAGRRELGRGARERRRQGPEGPTRWEPQRSCSLAARSPVSYVPIETCSRRGTRSAPGPGGRRAPARATRSQTVASRGTTGARSDARGSHRSSRHECCSDRRALEGHAGLGQRALHDGDDSEGLDEPQRAPDERDRHPSAEPRLRAGGRLDRPSGSSDGGTHEVGPCTSTPFWSAMPEAQFLHAAEGSSSPCASTAPPNERRSTRRRGISPALRGGAPRAGRPPPRGWSTAGRRLRSRASPRGRTTR